MRTLLYIFTKFLWIFLSIDGLQLFSQKPNAGVIVGIKGVHETSKISTNGIFMLSIPDKLKKFEFMDFLDMRIINKDSVTSKEFNIYL